MSDGAMDPHVPGGEDVDPGEPITELAGFEHDVSSALLSRIRRAIQRRTAASQLTSFAFYLPMVLLKELWLMMMSQFESKRVGKDAGNEGKAS
jgi:hypothetical protein